MRERALHLLELFISKLKKSVINVKRENTVSVILATRDKQRGRDS